MYLVLNRMNTKNIILKPFKSKIPVHSISCLLTDNKSFHLSHSQNDKDDNEKNKDKLNEAKKRAAKLAKFSFVQIKEEPSKIKHVTEMKLPEVKLPEVKLPEPNLLDHQKPKTKLNQKIKKLIENSNKVNQQSELIPKGKSFIWSKQTFSKRNELDPKVAQKLAKMIDPKNTDETARLLTEPFKQIHVIKSKYQDKSKYQESTNKDAFNLR